MKGDNYSAKEAAKILRLPTTTFYRKVHDGHIPYAGKNPYVFPKDAIDAIAELDKEAQEADKLEFKVSPRGDLWKKRQIAEQAHGIEDPLSYKTALAWQKRNDEIFMQVSQGENILGWVTFLPLAEEISIALTEGKMKEEAIAPEAIKAWDDPQLSVYISGLEVAQTTDETKDKVVAAFLIRNSIKWALTLIEQYDIQTWYGIGTNAVSQTILEALGFKQITSMNGGKRKGYRLENLTRPSKLLRAFLRNQ
jgi:excisionase family DNA binding protein